MKKENDKKMAPTTPSVVMPKIKKQGLKGFYKSVIREMSHVNWPPRQETNRLTGVVVTVCLISASILFVLSMLFNAFYVSFLKGG